MTPKDLFLHNKDRAERFRAVTKSRWFLEDLVSVRAQFMNTPRSEAEIKGALAYEATLLDMVDELPEAEDVPQSRLTHNLDIPPRTLPDEKSNPKNQP